MQYKAFQDVSLSRLGMGNMRLPTLENADGQPIDYDRAKAIIDSAVRAGVNYFDTAYIYHGGESERFVGRALADYPRESYYVADKFNLDANPDYRAEFAEQLERLNMEYIDFYLLHGIGDHSVDSFLSNGCVEYFDGMKKEGKIRWFGFSFHGSPDSLRRLLKAYHWDFVQIQLNYYDWYFGTAKEQYEILTQAGIPVIVMEPVHGGMLAKLNEETAQMLKAAAPERTLASWAMRWVLGLENVQVVLSGMSDLDQLQDNVNTFSESLPLNGEEQALVEKAVRIYRADVSVPCTACRYCCPDCPAGLEIPALMAAYNDAKIGGAWRLASLTALPEEKRPAACIGCGSCTGHCPQRIDVPKYMREMAELMK